MNKAATYAAMGILLIFIALSIADGSYGDYSRRDDNYNKPAQTEDGFKSDKIFIGSSYISDGFTYDIRVGDVLTLYNPAIATTSLYAYFWDIKGGDGEVELDHSGDVTCGVTGVKKGKVTLETSLYYNTGLYYGPKNETITYTVTINVLPANAEKPNYGNVPGNQCPRCNGTRTNNCSACYGDGVLQNGSACSDCNGGKVPCYLCNGTGMR